jgi:hypothetical protein
MGSYIIRNFGAATCIHAGIFLTLFDPEDGGDTFLRNVGRLSKDYTALCPRKWYSSILSEPVISTKPTAGAKGRRLTHIGEVVHEDDLLEQVWRRAVEHGVDSAQEHGPCLVVEADDDRRGWKLLQVATRLLAPVKAKHSLQSRHYTPLTEL